MAAQLFNVDSAEDPPAGLGVWGQLCGFLILGLKPELSFGRFGTPPAMAPSPSQRI